MTKIYIEDEERLRIYDTGRKVEYRWFTVKGSQLMMKQDVRWNLRCQEVGDFIKTNYRNPSKHRIEEHDMLNWLKANRKVMNAGRMKAERVEPFMKLLKMCEQYRRKNQYE